MISRGSKRAEGGVKEKVNYLPILYPRVKFHNIPSSESMLL